ncbi:hypothetical protein R1flu_001420 [Riccia fluitans]|uniref:Uncharacterized protein n=1 Tax=Riccia fluitans TaxID=41844 RepID=A0ABD1Y3N5_9MARC
MSIGHGALPATALWAVRAGERATGSTERAARWSGRPAAVFHMAARRVASALLATALHAATILKHPRGRFRVRKWERERVVHIALLDRAS